MKVAVISDIHDNLKNLAVALEQIEKLQADVLLFLGDFCAPFTFAQLAEGFSGPIHVVFGNNDGDLFLISQIAAKHSHVKLHGQLAELELDGKRVGLNHYPDIAKRLAESGAYDAVFSGHDHKAYVHQIKNTLWANPGEVMGRFDNPSFGMYNTTTAEFLHVALAK